MFMHIICTIIPKIETFANSLLKSFCTQTTDHNHRGNDITHLHTPITFTYRFNGCLHLKKKNSHQGDVRTIQRNYY